MKSGSLHAYGATGDGTPVDLSAARGIDDFVSVRVTPNGRWAALRANGTLVSKKVDTWTRTEDTAKERAARMLCQELEKVASVECFIRSAAFLLKDGRVRVFNDAELSPVDEELHDVVQAAISAGGRITALTADGRIVYRGGEDTEYHLPAARRVQKFTAIRVGSALHAASRPDGAWDAWGFAQDTVPGLCDKIRALGPAVDIAVATRLKTKSSDDGIVLWIE